ncbi:MAG TPA: SMI1/KNR4 family protein, partial [Clostridium sp.]|nr:SMI1/KNR4 family protein [Clostridium sp.]
MENKLEFLRKYHKNIQLVNIKEIDVKLIPSDWYRAFMEKDIKYRIKNILSIWEKYSCIELRNTISYLYENIVEIDLIEYDGKYSILYSIKASDGKINYYE